ncbi:zinc finger protein 85-like [Anopheles moucheti]|uniref:zinc finger protein 85-like n=1 Tax=Anopheles moucheti TaxID=186751 RepID=UPI0022F1168C|nr:zinc finger protein 85-like [Anopheles moucheti]
MSYKHCRICYKPDQDDLISVRLMQESITIEEMIRIITSISVSSDRRLPQNICLQCLDRLKVAYDLRQQCIQTNDRLLKELGCNLDVRSNAVEEKEQIIPEFSTAADGENNEEIEIIENGSYDGHVLQEQDQLEHTITEHYAASEGINYACCGCTMDFSTQDELEEHAVQRHRNGKTFSKYEIVIDFEPSTNESRTFDEDDSNADEGDLSIDIKFNNDSEESDIDEEEEQTTFKSLERVQSASIQNAMCRIPGSNLFMVSQEPGYMIVEMIQHRCCCCADLFSTERLLEKHLEKRDKTTNTTHDEHVKYACEYCGKQFAYWLVYVCHKRIREQRQFYMCTLCNALVDSKKRMISHMLMTDEHANYFNVCRESIAGRYEAIALPGTRCCCCKKYFDDDGERVEHIKRMHGPSLTSSSADKAAKLSYCCGVCGRRFRSERHVELHLQYARNVTQYYCKLCDFQTYNPRRMELHLYCGIHRDVLPTTIQLKPLGNNVSKASRLRRYCCFEGCHKQFHGEAALTQHINQCHQQVLTANRMQAKRLNQILQSESYHECNVCSVLFKNIGALQSHQAPNTQEGFVCSVCGISKRTRTALRVHERSHTGEKPFRCEHCDKTFTSNRTLVSHRSCHITGQHKCAQCGRAFNRKENLNRHISLKHGEATIPCDVCPKKFKTITVLNIHKLSHTGEKRFKCRTETCDKRYLTVADRRRHEMSVHTFERPHKCSYCNAAFIRKRQLMIHERRHTGDKPYVCPSCGKDFVDAYPLRNHMRNVCKETLNG